MKILIGLLAATLVIDWMLVNSPVILAALVSLFIIKAADI